MAIDDSLQAAVRNRYADAARRITESSGSGCCAGGCCGDSCGCGDSCDPVSAGNYASAELEQVGLTSGTSLGCGNPTALAELHPGEAVLDLGSGAGLDVLLSAARVGPAGHAYGVDMTDEMLALANANRERAGVTNATFLKGTIEAIPLPDASVDVVISNCVINLAADKTAVLREAFRVLRPGGRLAVSDMVEVEPLPRVIKERVDAWAGCVAGTIPIEAYRGAVLAAGFEESRLEVTRTFTPAEAGVEDATTGGRIGSASIRARKPAPSQRS